jgi:hypothetical protein
MTDAQSVSSEVEVRVDAATAFRAFTDDKGRSSGVWCER